MLQDHKTYFQETAIKLLMVQTMQLEEIQIQFKMVTKIPFWDKRTQLTMEVPTKFKATQTQFKMVTTT